LRCKKTLAQQKEKRTILNLKKDHPYIQAGLLFIMLFSFLPKMSPMFLGLRRFSPRVTVLLKVPWTILIKMAL
jgi:hypothetical protein